MTAVFCLGPVTLYSSQAWKSHIQCWCSDLPTTTANTHSVLTPCDRVPSVLCAHYLIWLSWQYYKEGAYSHPNFAYEEKRHKKVREFEQVIKPRPSDSTVYTLTTSPQLPLQAPTISPLLDLFDGTELLWSNFSGWPSCSSPHMNISSLSQINKAQPSSKSWWSYLHCISHYVNGFLAQKQRPGSDLHTWKARGTFQVSRPWSRFPRTIPEEERVHGRWCKMKWGQIQHQTLSPPTQSNELGTFLNY